MSMKERKLRSHGTGHFDRCQLGACGEGSIFEGGVLIFHPESIFIGDDVYVGHNTMLKGYYKNRMKIGSGTWIGQQVFMHSAGGLSIGENVGIGPGVKIITSAHSEAGLSVPILHSPIEISAVCIKSDSDLGVGSIILPGVTVGRGAQIGAGAVVSRDVPDYAVVAGVPARVIRMRNGD